MAPRTHDQNHETHDYPRAVAEGKAGVGELVRLACERHLTDLVSGPDRGLWFDGRAADLACNFFSLLSFSKGKWGGGRFVLEPWQKFMVGSLFGWKRADGTRRYREGHLEVARKNGKTETAAGVALKLLIADAEPGAEVYCLATKRDQAKLTFDVAKLMASKSPSLMKHLRRMKSEVRHDSTASKLVPLGADADSLDGLNVHGAIKDELHAWKTRDLWDVIDTATGARSQPFGLSTTTAGYNRRSIWWERRELVVKMLRGVDGFSDDSLFGLIFCPDDGDDWESPDVWPRGNPNIGVTVRAEEIGEQAAKAKRSAGGVNAFRRLRLNEPTEVATQWLNMRHWRACAEPFTEESLSGRSCFGGLDLSLTTDLTAWALVFLPTDDDPVFRVLVRHWLPSADIEEKEMRDGSPYRRWNDGRRLELSQGDWVDYGLIRRRMIADSQQFNLISFAYDAKFAPALVQRVMDEDGLVGEPMHQGFLSLNTPTKELYRMLLAKELLHEGCPLLEQQAENAAVEEDAAGNLKPTKAKSSRRIDGIAAMVNALALAIREKTPQGGGVFELDFDPFS